MQVLVLAAGMGKRLTDLTQSKTKCMVEVNGTSLIDRALKSISCFDIERIIIVIGYKGDSLREYIGDTYNGIQIVYVENKIYDKTNNIYSLYLAKDLFKENDTLLVESDLIFDESVVNKIINANEENLVLVDKYQSWMDGTVVKINEKEEIQQFVSKEEFDFYDIEHYYKTVNIYKFSKDFITEHYIPFLEAYCKSVGHNEYYENVLKVLAFINTTKLKACILDEKDRWYEIDDKQDLHNAETLFSDDISSYQLRYGGYWRFPFLKDFCYLVNPYFPPKRMVDEFKVYFDTLLHAYPSTGSVQSILAAKMFDIEPNNVIVGNGAAEIINSLLSSFGSKKIGVTVPTFHEYVSRVPEENLKLLEVDNNDFSYSASDLIEFSRNIDVLVLINPDNPSGNFINKEEVIELIDRYKQDNKMIILDESFVDFSSEGEENSLIKRDIIERFDNLIIIKSISKSYGVPGIRLGVIVSSNMEIMAKVKPDLSVWNINSYGEFFFQIYGKYENDYLKATKKISSVRDKLYDDLCEIEYLRPIKSQANYFLCEVDGISATELTKIMMRDFNILLKDCTGKLGFNNKQFIRVAVRDTSDNDFLIKALNDLKIKVDSYAY